MKISPNAIVLSVLADGSALQLVELAKRAGLKVSSISKALGRLKKDCKVFGYGPRGIRRYASAPFDAAARAAVDQAVADNTRELNAKNRAKSNERNRAKSAEKARAAGVDMLKRGRKPKPKPAQKTAEQLGLIRRAAPVQAKSLPRSAIVVIPDNVRRIERTAQADYRYHVDPAHTGEFSRQWKQLRSAA